ncbi:MAG: hypothetical protein ACO32I_07975 [Candidatus Limnocylindrus sp.]|jgi:hypothetical protein
MFFTIATLVMSYIGIFYTYLAVGALVRGQWDFFWEMSCLLFNIAQGRVRCIPLDEDDPSGK